MSQTSRTQCPCITPLAVGDLILNRDLAAGVLVLRVVEVHEEPGDHLGDRTGVHPSVGYLAVELDNPKVPWRLNHAQVRSSWVPLAQAVRLGYCASCGNPGPLRNMDSLSQDNDSLCGDCSESIHQRDA